MLFVRCKGGVSHSPKEYVSDGDIHVASTALWLMIQKEAISPRNSMFGNAGTDLCIAKKKR